MTNSKFVPNTALLQILHARSRGDADELASLVFASELNYLDNPVAEFEDGHLFFGAEVNAADADFLKSKQITHVFNVAGSHSARMSQEAEYISITIDDKEDTVLPLETCINTIHQIIARGERVLVHCIEGRSRSGAIIIAYLMKQHKWTYDFTLAHVRKQRFAQPNKGFEFQLRKL